MVRDTLRRQLASHGRCVPRAAWWVYLGAAWWVGTPVHTTRVILWVYTSLVYRRVYLPGYTTLPLPSVHPLPLTLRCQLTGHQAQEGRNPWVEGLSASQVLKSVRVMWATMRIVTPLFLHNLEQRLDSDRVTAHVSPMVRVMRARRATRSCIRSLLFMPAQRDASLINNVHNSRPMGLYPMDLNIINILDIPAVLGFPRRKVKWFREVFPGLRIDTGGERRLQFRLRNPM